MLNPKIDKYYWADMRKNIHAPFIETKTVVEKDISQ